MRASDEESYVSRMRNRGGVQQMPPLASEQVDGAGIAAVSAWMERLRAQLPPLPALPQVEEGVHCDGVEEVFEIFERASCRSAFCHGAGTGEPDFSTPEQLHASLVGVRASGEGCDELPLR